MRSTHVFATAVATVASLFTAGPALAQPAGDEIVTTGSPSLFTSVLPNGPRRSTVSVAAQLRALTYLDDGRLVGVVTPQQEGDPAAALVEVEEDGTIVPIGEVAIEGLEIPVDLATSSDGTLYLLTYGFYWNPPDDWNGLYELNPSSGAVRSSRILDGPVVNALAPAARGLLWGVGDRVYEIDPDSGLVRASAVTATPSLPPHSADADSSGALWVAGSCPVCSPPIHQVERIDPASGSTRPAAAALFDFGVAAVAVRRRCQETATARCLQGGRFRVEVSWAADQGNSQPGRAAPARSADTALFSFFDPANWELLVKVLDSCENDGHFWVFASATTNVGFLLRVTDLESGQVRLYDNPLGQTAMTVTDTSAFATCP